MEKDIGKIPKNDQTDIIVRVDDFGGKLGLTIREYVNSERYTGFTKAGVRISAENFDKFKEMINSVKKDDLKAPEGEDSGTGNDEDIPVERPGRGKKVQEDLPDY